MKWLKTNYVFLDVGAFSVPLFFYTVLFTGFTLYLFKACDKLQIKLKYAFEIGKNTG